VPGSPTTPDLEAGRGPANCENGGNGGNGGNGNVHFDPSLPPGSTSPVFGSDSVSGASRRPSGAGAAGMNDPADKERERYHWVSPSAGGGTGDEPGVNVRSKRDEEAYSHLTAASQVTVSGAARRSFASLPRAAAMVRCSSEICRRVEPPKSHQSVSEDGSSS
jgi:hypothetical protein